MDVHNLKDLYTDYLILSTDKTTATGLSAMTDSLISHDKVTRLLSSGEINSRSLWEEVKPMCHEISSEDAVLIFDDSVEEKRYTDNNEMICWHYDHTQGRSVKGVNFMTALYHSDDMSLPIGVEFIRKSRSMVNKKGRMVKQSEKNKNQLYREMLWRASYNINFKYVLNDSWFTNSENMDFVVTKCKCHFIMALKENRKVAVSKEAKEQGIYVSIKSLELEGRTMSVYFEKLDFPVLVSKQVFKNEDGSTGALYLVSSDLSLQHGQMAAIYQKRWKVEEYHKSIKSNTAFAKSPTRTVQTQTSHFIASVMAFVKLERLKVRRNMNHFALKNRIYLQAVKAAMKELQKLSTPHYELSEIYA